MKFADLGRCAGVVSLISGVPEAIVPQCLYVCLAVNSVPGPKRSRAAGLSVSTARSWQWHPNGGCMPG